MPIDKKIRYKKSHGKVPLILVTNDDGIYSDGLHTLVKVLKRLGRVVVVAPNVERSAASHALTLHRPLRVEKMANDLYAVDGTPTDCINLAVNKILKTKPLVIVSGINKGGNLGDDLHYSGTVSAAVEGGILGIPSIAISLTDRQEKDFSVAANFARRLTKKVLSEGLPPGIILNANVPKNADIKNYEFTKQGKRNYGDIIVEKIDPRGRKYYWIGGDEAGFEDISDSDCNAVLAGRISITPIRVNLTDHVFLQKIKNWKL